MNKPLTIQFVLASLAALSILAVEPSGTLFENDNVKVIRGLEKAHVKSAFHEHKPNRVMVYLQPGRQRFEYQDTRQPVVFDWKAGQVVWSPAEGMHSPEVVSDDPFNIIEVEVKKPGAKQPPASSRDALKADRKHYQLEFENDQVRVLRMKLGAHEATPVIEDTHNHVIIFMNDQDVRTIDAAGTAVNAKRKFGETVWEASGIQKLENTGNQSLEILVVDLKI